MVNPEAVQFPNLRYPVVTNNCMTRGEPLISPGQVPSLSSGTVYGFYPRIPGNLHSTWERHHSWEFDLRKRRILQCANLTYSNSGAGVCLWRFGYPTVTPNYTCFGGGTIDIVWAAPSLSCGNS